MNNKNFEIVDIKDVTIRLVKVQSTKDNEYYVMNDGITVQSAVGNNSLTATEKNEIVKELGNGPESILNIDATSNDEISCNLGSLFINYIQSLETEKEKQQFKDEILMLIKETLDEY